MILLIFMLYSHNKLTKVCYEIINISNILEDFIVDEDWDNGYDKTIELIESIKTNSSPLSLYINHTEFDNINCEAIKLTQYIETRDNKDSLSSIHLIKFSAETILRLQEIDIKNIF